MRKAVIAIFIQIIFLSAFLPSQFVKPGVVAKSATLMPTSTTSSPTRTPTTHQVMDFWNTRIEIPVNDEHWKIYDFPDHETNSVDYFRDVVFDSSEFAWINTAKGFWKIKDGLITEIECSDLYGNSKLIYYYPVPDMTTGKNKMYGEVFPPCMIHQTINDMMADNENNLWISLEKYLQEIVFYGNDQVGWKYYRFTGKVDTIALDREGVVWVAYHTAEDAISLAYRKNDRWHRIPLPRFNRSPDWVESITFDSENSIWLYTSEGIIKQQQNEWINISEVAPEMSSNCEYGGQRFLTSDLQGEIWGIDKDCVFHWNGAAWDVFNVSSPYPYQFVDVVFDQNGKIWSGNGFMKDGKNYYFDTDKLWNLQDITVGPDNSIWFATAGYLMIYDNKEEIP